MSIEIVNKQELDRALSRQLKQFEKLLQEATAVRPEWASAAAIGTLLDISPQTVRRLGEAGLIQVTKIGGLVRYNIESARSLANSHPEKYRPI